MARTTFNEVLAYTTFVHYVFIMFAANEAEGRLKESFEIAAAYTGQFVAPFYLMWSVGWLWNYMRTLPAWNTVADTFEFVVILRNCAFLVDAFYGDYFNYPNNLAIWLGFLYYAYMALVGGGLDYWILVLSALII